MDSEAPLPPIPGRRGFRKPQPDFPIPKDFWKSRPIPVPEFKPLGMDWAKAKAAMGLSANAIVNQILYAIGQAVIARGKTLSPDALGEFAPVLRAEVLVKLFQEADWTAEGPNVLSAATLMGNIAASLADPSTVVAKAHIHAAFPAVRDGSTTCVSAGSGSWCDFWI